MPRKPVLMATNPSNTEFGDRTAFLIAVNPFMDLPPTGPSSWEGEERLRLPVALHRIGLETRLSPGEDPCAVLQLHIDLLPGAVEEIYFVLGQGQQ